MMVVRLETSDGQFITNAEPVLPLEPTDIVVWGERFFIRKGTRRGSRDVWIEVYPTVVR